MVWLPVQLRTTELDVWKSRTNATYALSNTSSATLDDLMYVIRGYSAGNKKYNQIYDPMTDSWTNGLTHPDANPGLYSAGVGCLYDDCVYDFCGEPYEDHVKKYDPSTNSWSSVTDYPTEVERHRAEYIDGLIYIFAGNYQNWDGTALNDAYEYDPDADGYTAIADTPTGFAGHVISMEIDGLVYLMKGTAVCSYDPDTDTYDTSLGARTAQSQDAYKGVSVSSVGYIFVDSTGYSYDPATDTWTAQTAMTTPRHICGIGMLYGHVYVACGIRNSDSVKVSTLESYNTARAN